MSNSRFSSIAFSLILLAATFAPHCLLAEESARDPSAAITACQLMYRWNDFNGLPGSVDGVRQPTDSIRSATTKTVRAEKRKGKNHHESTEYFRGEYLLQQGGEDDDKVS